MSLNQKYTWNDFLKEHPEFKTKGLKRTSAEGKKAFEAAYKAFIKKYLSGRTEQLTRELERATKRRDARITVLKGLRSTKKHSKATLAQRKVGRSDRAIVRLKKQQEKTKTAEKSF